LVEVLDYCFHGLADQTEQRLSARCGQVFRELDACLSIREDQVLRRAMLSASHSDCNCILDDYSVEICAPSGTEIAMLASREQGLGVEFVCHGVAHLVRGALDTSSGS
jgi:hypothetical protein